MLSLVVSGFSFQLSILTPALCQCASCCDGSSCAFSLYLYSIEFSLWLPIVLFMVFLFYDNIKVIHTNILHFDFFLFLMLIVYIVRFSCDPRRQWTTAPSLPCDHNWEGERSGWDRETERERNFCPLVYSLKATTIEAESGWDQETELHLISHMDGREPRTWNHILLLRHVSRKLIIIRSGTPSQNFWYHMQVSQQCFNPLLHDV